MMEAHVKEETETDPEMSITDSWILLNSDEDFDALQEASKCLENNSPTDKNEDTHTGENYSTPSIVGANQNIIDTNNKSDAESDGISIISESEFFSRSDDDCSTNSSDDNTVYNFKNAESSETEYKHIEDLNEPNESSSDIEIVPSLSSSNDNDMTLQNMTESDNFEESNETNQDNLRHAKNDKKFTKKQLIDYFQRIFKYNSMCFIGTLLLAITVTHISSKFAQDNCLDQNSEPTDDQNKITNDGIVNTRLFEYDRDIYECSSLNHDYSDEQCIKRATKDIKPPKKLKPPKTSSFDSRKLKTNNPDDENNEIISSEKCHNKQTNKYKNKKQSKQDENFRKSERKKQKDNSELDKEKLQLEKENIENWRINLKKEEKRLKEWEKKLKKTEKKLYEKEKIKDNLYRNDENKYKFKKTKTKENFKKFDESRFDKTFKDKTDYNKYRNGGKKINLQKSQTQKVQKVKDKTDKYKKKIQATYDAKLRNFLNLYTRKKNTTRSFDDNNTITGEWYLNLVRGRNDKREKGDKAEWWFERANYRKTKRNKAYWYFQYMFNREDMRYVNTRNL